MQVRVVANEEGGKKLRVGMRGKEQEPFSREGRRDFSRFPLDTATMVESGRFAS